MRALQPFFYGLYKLALKGMNYGAAAFEPKNSGEDAVLKMLSAWLPKNAIVFDVGANTGQFAKVVKTHFPKSQLHCFEPSISTFELLKEKLNGVSGVVFTNIGLSNTITSQQLYFAERGSVQASLNVEAGFSHSEEVQLTTLDAYCDATGIESIDFLKIDVEGYEYHALQGAAKMLAEKRITYIQFEFGNHQIITRHFLNDFHQLLSDYAIYRVVQNGVYPLGNSVFNELFPVTNYFAVRKDVLQSHKW